MRKKVIILERVFSAYRKPVFDLINEEVDLLVLHGENNSGIRSVQTTYSKQVPSKQYAKNDTAVILFPIKTIKEFKPDVIICDFALGMVNIPYLILYCKKNNIQFVFWSHGYNRKTGFKPEKRLLDKYRLMLLKSADANIVYGKKDKELLQNYLPSERIFVAPNTIDTSEFIKIRNRLELETIPELKRRLSIKQQFNIVYISRLLKSKRPDLLVDLYQILRDQYGYQIAVHYVGDGEMLEPIRDRVRDAGFSNDFYFHGSIHDPVKSGELLFMADMMVLPGDLGLSVNHAFCFDCPVLSFATHQGFPAHGPEVEYVINNETGFLVEKHNPEAMANVLHNYLENVPLQASMKRFIRKAIENELGLKQMVAGVLDCIRYITKHL